MKNNKGFTLIELVVVIAIIAVLSISVSAGVQNAYTKAQTEEKEKKLKQIETAARIYSKLSSINYVSGQGIDISVLVAKGLLDEEIQNYNFCGKSGKITNIAIDTDKGNSTFIINETNSGSTLDDLC